MIQIHLLRVSPDSQWLEFMVECPTDYRFNTLYITRYNVLTKQDDVPKDGSALYNTNADISPLHIQTIRIATSALGTETTMYKVEFKANITPGTEETQLTTVGLCSNVNFVYANLLDLVLSFTNCCISQNDYDNLDRNHMILYAHQEAMRLERYTEAKFFYDILWNLFTNCGPSTRQSNVINRPCNCN